MPKSKSPLVNSLKAFKKSAISAAQKTRYKQSYKQLKARMERAKRLMENKIQESRRLHQVALKASAKCLQQATAQLPNLISFITGQHEWAKEDGIVAAILRHLPPLQLLKVKQASRHLCLWVASFRMLAFRTWSGYSYRLEYPE